MSGKGKTDDPVTVALVLLLVGAVLVVLGVNWWADHNCDVSAKDGISVTCPGKDPVPPPPNGR